MIFKLPSKLELHVILKALELVVNHRGLLEETNDGLSEEDMDTVIAVKDKLSKYLKKGG